MKQILMGPLLIMAIQFSLSAGASDGDVVYSAPYIWVNPETGQLETRNPGPRLKNHEQLTIQAKTAVVSLSEGAPGTTGSDTAEQAGDRTGQIPVHPLLIVFAGMVATVVMITIMGKRGS